MADRWLYLQGGGTSLLIDLHPTSNAMPRIVHFGDDLGQAPDFDAFALSAALVTWGARLDHPVPACVLPGLEPGYFGALVLEARAWRFERAEGSTFHFSGEGARLALEYQMFDCGVLGVRLNSTGVSPRASFALPLPGSVHEILSFGGDWAREFAAQRQTLAHGRFVLESFRGRPGHDRFPGVVVGERGFGENHGDVYGVSLGWSGSLSLSVERLREGQTIVLAGEALNSDLNCQSPWVYASFSGAGLNGLLAKHHRFLREEILPANLRRKARPVHYNTWEAIYFDHKLETLQDLAGRAARVGAERFVLDDGWFKGRNNDQSSLGDWTVDRQKYPDGLSPLIKHVRDLGLEFGLWVEPEMVNPDSDLARAHPDWIRRESTERLLLQRHQAVLDLTNNDVTEHLFSVLHELLVTHNISYLKWDMNRDLTGSEHGAYVRALYALIDRLRAAHPHVEIETCASGGGRCDWEMLTRAERVWVSDSNDALDRFEIQRQAALFLPLEVIGAHVGPAVCHITGRRLSLDLRAHVASFGHMGLELDLRQLSEQELARLQQHIANYKRFRPLLHSGQFYRMTLDDDHAAIGVVSADKREGLILVMRMGSAFLGRATKLRLSGLDPDRVYRLSAVAPLSASLAQTLGTNLLDSTLALSGQMLKAHGVELFLARPETSLLLHIRAS